MHRFGPTGDSSHLFSNSATAGVRNEIRLSCVCGMLRPSDAIPKAEPFMFVGFCDVKETVVELLHS